MFDGLSANVNYQWYVDDISQNGQTNDIFDASSVSEGSKIKCVVSLNSDICASPSPASSNEVTATFNNIPPVPIIRGMSSNCGPDSLSLSASTTDVSVFNHKWYFSPTLSSEVSEQYISTLVMGDALISECRMYFSSTTTLYVSSANECGESARIPVTATINSSPQVYIEYSMGDPSAVCPDGSFVMSASMGTDPIWKQHGVDISGAIYMSFTPTESDTYTVSVETSCGPSISDELEVIVLQEKNLSVTIERPFPVYPGNPISFTANVSDGLSSDVDYLWYVDNVLQNGQSMQTFDASAVSAGSQIKCEINLHSGICALTSSATSNEIMLIFDTEYNQPELTFSNDLKVGSINGSAGVSPMGGATYQIPIKLPPGTAGIMPNLSIVYNSQSSAGMLGKGWSISGFSAITRIPTNLHDDGFIDGVNFNANDKFAMDGNRLVVTNNLPYGGEGTEYHTQMETFSIITSSGSVGGGPASFMVETKDGKMLEYGYTTDSRFVADGRSDVLIWLLNKVTDKNGNYYTIHYRIENKEYWPEEIKYTSNDAAAIQAYNSVKFHFDKKIDPSITFVANSEVNSSVILREIVIECEGSQINKYEFKYIEGFSSQLNEIIYYAGNDKINSTKVDWDWLTKEGRSAIPFGSVDLNGTSSNSNIISGDFNGDGYSDFVQIKYDGYNVTSLDLFRNYNTDNISSDFQNVYTHTINSRAEFYPGDFDGDGKTDLLYVEYGYYMNEYTYYIRMLLSSGQSFQEINTGIPSFTTGLIGKPLFNVGDFNADGKTDWAIMCDADVFDNTLQIWSLDVNNSAYIFGTSNKFNIGIRQNKVADFNGNGKPDIMLISDQFDDYTCQIFEYEESNTQLQLIEHGMFPTMDHRLFPGDFNGDGKTDLLSWVESAGWEIHYFGERDFIWTKFPEIPDLLSTDPDAEYYTLNVADFNGDGKDDIFEAYYPIHDGTVWCKYSTFYSHGTSFKKEFTEFDIVEKHSMNLLYSNDYKNNTDFNGDGKQDVLIGDYDNASERRILYFHPRELSNLVQSITNGFNETTKFDYLPFTNLSVREYSPNTSLGSTEEVKLINPAIQLVSKIYKPDGIGGDGFNWLSYHYSYLRLHNKGKGLLGFDEVFINDNFDNKLEMAYGYDPIFYTTYLKNKKTSLNALPTETILENKVKPISTTIGEKRYFPYIEWKEEKNYINNITIKSNFIYDDYGNVIFQEVAHGVDGKTEITNEYIENETWCLSAIKKSTSTKTRTAVAGSNTRVSEFYYLNGVLSEQIIDPGTTKELNLSFL